MHIDRRRFLSVLAGVAAGGAGASAYAHTSRADAGATFAASDVTVRTHDGALGAVTIAPVGTVSWSGLEEPAGSVALSLHAKLDSALEYRKLAERRLDAAGLHGETDYRFETRNLLDGPGFAVGDFEPDDGETLTRQVRLRLGVTVYATDDETVLTAGYADAAFDVTVENRPEDGSVEGEANTGGEATNDAETPETTETAEPETTASDRNGDSRNGGDGNGGGRNGGGRNGGGDSGNDDGNGSNGKEKGKNSRGKEKDNKKGKNKGTTNKNNSLGGIGSTGAASGE